MKSKWTKLLLVLGLMTVMIAIGAVSVYADNYSTGHFHPTGDTTTHYAYSSSQCDRTLNITFKDTSGSTVPRFTRCGSKIIRSSMMPTEAAEPLRIRPSFTTSP